jgi:hypothetical protein
MSNTLMTNAELHIGDSLTSPNGQYSLQMQSDSNLVLYHGPPSPTTGYWASGTEWLDPTRRPTRVLMQPDANLVMFDPAGVNEWMSGTWGPDFPDPFLYLGDDGNLVIFDKNKTAIWASGRPNGSNRILARGLVTAATKALNDFVAGCGDLPPVVTMPETAVADDNSTLKVDGVRYNVVAKKFKTVGALLQQSYLQDLGDLGVWPGMIIRGKEMLDGKVSTVGPCPRRLGTVTVSTNFPGATPTSQTTTVDNPDEGSVNDAIRTIVHTLNPSDSAGMQTVGFQRAYSLKEFFLKVGVNVKGSEFGVNADVSLDQHHDKTTVVATVRQVFYSVDFNPSGPYASGFWADSVTPAQVSGYMGPGDPPLYVRSVQYGRFIVVLMTGAHSAEDIKASADASYKSTIDAKANMTLHQKEVVDSCEVKIYTVGVPGSKGFKTLTDPVTELNEVYKNGATFSAANPGAAISFIASQVSNNKQAAVRVEAEYTKALSIIGEPAADSLTIFDGAGGGPVATGAVMNPGDTLTVSADGAIYTGIVFAGTTPPAGWLGRSASSSFPAPDITPYSLIAKIGNGDYFEVGSSATHTASATEQGPVEFAENDDNPTNGDPTERWNVYWSIARAGAGSVGVYV